MLIQPLNMDLLALREQQSYPLAEWVGETDVTGSFTLPRAFLLNLALPVDAGLAVASERFYVRSVTVYGDGVLVEIGYDDGTDTVLVGSALVPASTHTPYKSYPVVGRGDFAASRGTLTVGRIDDLPGGRYEFDLAGAQIEVDCVRPQVARVSGIVVERGAERTALLTGFVDLTAGDGARWSVDQTGESLTARLDGTSGAGDGDCPCDEDAAKAQPITSINLVRPNSAGRIEVDPGVCLRIVAEGNILKIDNVCAKPCCGRTEVQVLLEEVRKLADQSASLEDFMNRLDTNVESLEHTVLASRIPST